MPSAPLELSDTDMSRHSHTNSVPTSFPLESFPTCTMSRPRTLHAALNRLGYAARRKRPVALHDVAYIARCFRTTHLSVQPMSNPPQSGPTGDGKPNAGPWTWNPAAAPFTMPTGSSVAAPLTTPTSSSAATVAQVPAHNTWHLHTQAPQDTPLQAKSAAMGEANKAAEAKKADEVKAEKAVKAEEAAPPPTHTRRYQCTRRHPQRKQRGAGRTGINCSYTCDSTPTHFPPEKCP